MCNFFKRAITVLSTLLTRKRRRGQEEPEDDEALTPPTTTLPETPITAANTHNSDGPQIARDVSAPLPAKSAMASKVSCVPGSASPKKKVRFQATPVDTPKPSRATPKPRRNTTEL